MGHHRLYGCFFYKLLYPSVHSPVRSFVSSLGTNNEFTQKYNIILFYSRAPLLRTSSFTPAQCNCTTLLSHILGPVIQAALLVLISMTYALCIFTDNRKLKNNFHIQKAIPVKLAEEAGPGKNLHISAGKVLLFLLYFLLRDIRNLVLDNVATTGPEVGIYERKILKIRKDNTLSIKKKKVRFKKKR